MTDFIGSTYRLSIEHYRQIGQEWVDACRHELLRHPEAELNAPISQSIHFERTLFEDDDFMVQLCEIDRAEVAVCTTRTWKKE